MKVKKIAFPLFCCKFVSRIKTNYFSFLKYINQLIINKETFSNETNQKTMACYMRDARLCGRHSHGTAAEIGSYQ